MNPKFGRKTFFGICALLFLFLFFTGATKETMAADDNWDVKYWNNTDLSGDPVLQRTESTLDNDWGDGSPAPGTVNVDEFSARWLRDVYFAAGNYRFTATTDDGMRVWVDGVLIIDSWWDSQVHSESNDIYLYAGDHEIEVEYYEAGGKAVAKLSWSGIGGTTNDSNLNWKGEYFNNTTLSGSPALVRDDPAIDFDWGDGSPAVNIIDDDQFSVRWTRSLTFNSGRYRFTVTADDGVRLWVNNQLLIGAWTDHTPTTFTGDIDLSAGSVPLRLEYFENTGGARVQLSWTQISSTTPSTPTPSPTPTAGTGIVQSAWLNIRTGPGLQYGIITTVPRGEVLSLAGYRSADGNWVMINWGAATAWVSGLPQYLWSSVPLSSMPVWSGSVPATGGPTTSPTTQTVATGTVAYCYYLNTRSGPGTNFPIIRAVRSGTVVSIFGRNSASTWVKVRLYDGTIGWMSSAYVVESVSLINLPITN